MVGIDEVAHAAGVSTATVSRALSGRGRISDATRARVRLAAAELGYVVSSAASALASGRAENIGVVVPLQGHWFFGAVLDGMASQLAPRGYDMTLYNLTGDPGQRRGLFERSLHRGRVDAVVVLSVALTDAERAQLTALGLPVVGLGVPGEVPISLRVDDDAVGRAATQHLLDLGHREIAHIGLSLGRHPLDVPTRRRRGFEAAMAAAGLSSSRFEAADFTASGGYSAALRLLRETDAAARPTAIFAASDEMAIGAILAARELGLDVPGDLSVVGVDGHDLGLLMGLTTIDQFPHEQGERAGRAVLDALGVGERGTDAEASLPFELVVRTSTARPRGGPA